MPCAGSVTPWNTHLGSEEYPADARQIADLDELPERQLEIEDFTEKRLGGVADNGIDDQKTGGVVQ